GPSRFGGWGPGGRGHVPAPAVPPVRVAAPGPGDMVPPYGGGPPQPVAPGAGGPPHAGPPEGGSPSPFAPPGGFSPPTGGLPLRPPPPPPPSGDGPPTQG